MNIDELEDWSQRAAQALQDFCDEAQVSAGNPDGEDQLLDIRALLHEHSRICAGRPLWQSQVSMQEDESLAALIHRLG